MYMSVVHEFSGCLIWIRTVVSAKQPSHLMLSELSPSCALLLWQHRLPFKHFFDHIDVLFYTFIVGEAHRRVSGHYCTTGESQLVKSRSVKETLYLVRHDREARRGRASSILASRGEPWRIHQRPVLHFHRHPDQRPRSVSSPQFHHKTVVDFELLVRCRVFQSACRSGQISGDDDVSSMPADDHHKGVHF